jgi:hypothetical protein
MIRWLTSVHRWAGGIFSLYMATLCISGAVLLFVPYPELKNVDWLNQSPLIAFSRIKVPPAVVLRQAQVSDVEIVDVNGEPVYLLHPEKAPQLLCLRRRRGLFHSFLKKVPANSRAIPVWLEGGAGGRTFRLRIFGCPKPLFLLAAALPS